MQNYLVPNLMCYFDAKLSIEAHFLAHIIGELLRGIVRISNIPLKFILKVDLVDPNVKLNCFNPLIACRCGLVRPVILNFTFYGRGDLMFLLNRQAVLLGQQFGKHFGSHLVLIKIPAEYLLALAICI